MNGKPYLVISGGLFGVIALLHITRLIYGWHAEIGSWTVPLWMSWLGLVLPGALSAWAFRLTRVQR